MKTLCSYRGLGLLALSFFVLAVKTWAADPSGTWKWKAAAAGREMESTLVLALTDGKLTGTIENRAGKAEIRDAKLDGDQITFTVKRKIRRRSLAVNYAGKIAGDTITGTSRWTRARASGVCRGKRNGRRQRSDPELNFAAAAEVVAVRSAIEGRVVTGVIASPFS